MSNFELPTNIRQIGSLDGSAGSLKIYVEDYVCTYLRQYAESGGHTEKIAFLVGKYMIIDGNPYVFVNGVIQGKHSEYADNMECFTDESYDYAENQMGKHFAGSEILGWMQSQPGYGVHLNPAYADYHMNNFTRPYQLLFVMDPIEKLNLFYAWNPEMSGIGEVGGYFVYYEQNKGMQEYMNANRISRVKTAETKPVEDKPKRLKIFDEIEKKQAAEKKRPPERGSEAMSGVKTTATQAQLAESRLAPKSAGKTVEDVRKLSNLLVGLCAVLFITVFIMGAGLLQSDSRIAALESAIITMDGNYVVMVEQMRTLAALPVFAEQNSPMHMADANEGQGTQTPTSQPTESQPHTPAPLPTPSPEMTPPPTPSPEPTPTPEPTEPGDDDDDDDDQNVVNVFANVPETYTIQPGDSLIAISRRFFGDITMVGRIMEVNDIIDPDRIVIGQVIYLPRY